MSIATIIQDDGRSSGTLLLTSVFVSIATAAWLVIGWWIVLMVLIQLEMAPAMGTYFLVWPLLFPAGAAVCSIPFWAAVLPQFPGAFRNVARSRPFQLRVLWPVRLLLLAIMVLTCPGSGWI